MRGEYDELNEHSNKMILVKNGFSRKVEESCFSTEMFHIYNGIIAHQDGSSLLDF
jgi:hypothetical protein